MPEVTLDEILSLNEELLALAEEGVPSQEAADGGVIQRINKSLSVRSSLGQSLLDATVGNDDLPVVYRSALEVGLRAGSLTPTMEGLDMPVSAEEQLRRTLRRAFVPTLISAAIAYAGFMVMCLYYAPSIEALYLQTQEQPSWPAGFILAMRDTMPTWRVLVPILFLAGIYLWWSDWIPWQEWVPGTQRYRAAVRNANFACQLKTLLRNGVSLPESLPIGASVTGDKELIQAATSLSEAHRRGELSSGDADFFKPLPPLLHWALTHDLGGQSLADVLEFAEKSYRWRAERLAEKWHVGLPIAISTVVGGSIVLVFGLVLFGPFVQLLQDLARH